MSLSQNAEAIQLAVAIGQPDSRRATQGVQVKDEFGRITAKRIFDIFGASLLLSVFAPIMVGIFLVLMIRGGSPIFTQLRVGKNGSMFRCYKFRTMVKDANRALSAYLESNPTARAEWNRSFKLANDPRVTRLGMFLRRSSLDELPQLFNVLIGDMSLVGPRPIVAPEIERYRDKIVEYCSCRPGLTGLWQVSGRNLTSYDRRVRLDVLYARRQSLKLDIAILFRTVSVVLSGRGAC
jgi:lipopolysaccharide/colanic/teichoic acid biosynthesis glycosyltransferase